MHLRIRVLGVGELLRDAQLVHAGLDRVLQLLHRGVAVLLLLLQALEDDGLVCLGHLRIERARLGRRKLQVADQHLAEVRAGERKPAGAELEHHHA